MFEVKKIEAYRSEKHLKWVRSKPCCSCGYDTGIEAHHIIGIGLGGAVSSKQDDSLVIPLCRRCHNECHNDPIGFDQFYHFARLIKNAFANNEITLNTEK